MSHDVTVRPTGLALNPTAALAGLAFAGLAVGFGARLAVEEIVIGVCIGGIGAAVAAAWVADYARRSRVLVRGDRLVLRETRSRERTIAKCASGKVVLYSEVRGGVAGSDRWAMWFDQEGRPLWTAAGRRWPIDQLLDACRALDIPLETHEAPRSAASLRRLHPGSVRWFEAHTTAVAIAGSFAVVVGVGLLLVLLGAGGSEQ